MSQKKKFTLEQARKYGEKLDVDWKKFDVEQFLKGMNIELEHGSRDAKTDVTDDDPLSTAKIALAHLTEFPDYYSRLGDLEKDAKEFWKNK